jgi:hypothetical protein
LATKVSPRRLTRGHSLIWAFAVWLSLVTRTAPLAHPALYLPDSCARCRHPADHGCTSMHFGENQLSPGSISISPLSTRHPPVLQHWWVRASTGSHPRFTLRMDSSPGFGSGAGNASRGSRPPLRPLQTRFRFSSTALPPLNFLEARASRCRHQLVGSFYKRHAVRLHVRWRTSAAATPSDCS